VQSTNQVPIDDSHEEAVLLGQDISRPMSTLASELVTHYEVSGSFTGCGFLSHPSLSPACFDNDGDAVIPRTDPLDE